MSATAELEALLFEVGGRTFGVRSGDVLELLRSVSIRPLPSAPSAVEGVVNVRGQVVPVIDIRARFGLPSKPLSVTDHFLLVQAGHRRVILRVDRAVEVKTVSLKATGEVAPELHHVAGVCPVAGDLIVIYDLPRFLSGPESVALEAALSASPAK